MEFNCYKIILILCFTMFTISCKQNQALLHDFENSSWNSKDSVVFSFDVLDHTESKNMSFFLRNNLDYPYRNIFFLVVRVESEYFLIKFFITLSFLDKYFFALFQYIGVLFMTCNCSLVFVINFSSKNDN